MFRREETGFAAYLIASCAMVLGLCVGYWFPDFDLASTPLRWFGLLHHRSILTHGFILPLLLFLAIIRQAHYRPNLNGRFALIGFTVAIATHLGFDLFPRSWYGFSIIHIPIIGRTSPLFSILWLFGSAVVCYWLSFRLLRNLGELMAVSASVVTCITFGAYREPRFLLALVVILCALFVAFVIPRRRQVVDLTDTPGMF